MTLLDRFNTSQDGDFQRRVKIAALMLAGQVITSPVPPAPAEDAPDDERAAYAATMTQREFASRVAGDPDGYAPRIALVLAAMSNVTTDTEDDALVKAMQGLFQVYRG